MQFKSLKVFCDVVGRGSFSRAADENGMYYFLDEIDRIVTTANKAFSNAYKQSGHA